MRRLMFFTMLCSMCAVCWLPAEATAHGWRERRFVPNHSMPTYRGERREWQQWHEWHTWQRYEPSPPTEYRHVWCEPEQGYLTRHPVTGELTCRRDW